MLCAKAGKVKDKLQQKKTKQHKTVLQDLNNFHPFLKKLSQCKRKNHITCA